MARTLFIEAACSARHKPKSKSAFIKDCPTGLADEVLEHAYKAQVRLHKTYHKLLNKGKNSNVARVAVARELVGFVWWIGVLVETKLDAEMPKAA